MRRMSDCAIMVRVICWMSVDGLCRGCLGPSVPDFLAADCINMQGRGWTGITGCSGTLALFHCSRRHQSPLAAARFGIAIMEKGRDRIL